MFFQKIILCLLCVFVCIASDAQKILASVSSLEGYALYESGIKSYEDSVLYYRNEAAGNYTPSERKIILEKYADAIKSYRSRLASFTRQHKNNEWSAIALLSAVYTQPENDFSVIEKQADVIESGAAQNKYLAELMDIIRARKNIATKYMADFALPDKNGRNSALSSIKGRYIVLSFWASWCQPCRYKNAQLKKVYDLYKKKGLEVIGVSLDESKTSWLNAIKRDDTNWINVVAEEGFKSKVAISYNVVSVPKTFLLDDKGNILHTDLQIADLINYLQKM